MNDCYRQFDNDADIAGVRNVRDSFARLSDDQQDVHISLWIVGRGFHDMNNPPCVQDAAAGEILPVSEAEAEDPDRMYMDVSDSEGGNQTRRWPGHYEIENLPVRSIHYGHVGQELADALRRQELADAVGLLAVSDGDVDDDAPAAADHGRVSRSGRVVARQGPGSRQLLGRTVCLRALVALLGVGHSRVERIRKEQQSLKHQPQSKHPILGQSLRVSKRMKWPGIMSFFWYLYHVVAENLPERTVAMSTAIQTRVATWDAEGQGITPDSDAGSGDDDEGRERDLQQLVLDMSQYGPSAGVDDAGDGPGTLRGPRRHFKT
jgi:hypothetical protein